MSATTSRWFSWVAIAGATLLLAACGTGGDGSAPAPSASQQNTAGVRGGTLTVAIPSDVSSFFDWSARKEHELEVIGLVFQPLAVFDRVSQAFVPALAASWTVLEGGRVIEFKLRPDARWDDGTPVTARDVLFTHRMQIAPEIDWVRRRDKQRIERVEAVDERTVRFVFHEPYATNLFDAVAGAIYPAHALESFDAARLADLAQQPPMPGNGLFRIGQHEAGQALELLASETHAGGRPFVDRIVFRVVPDKEARALMVESGEVDLLRAATVEQYERLTGPGKLPGFVVPVPKYFVIVWNTRREPLADGRVRRALALGLDRARMVELTQRGRGELCNGPFPPDSWANWKRPPEPRNRAAAEALLSEAGFERVGSDGIRVRGGERLELALTIPAGSRTYGDLAELIRRDLEPLGARVTVTPVEGTAMFDGMTRGEGQAWLIAETAEEKADLTNLAHSSQAGPGGMNYSGYRSPEFDAVCDKAAVTLQREAARPLWIKAQEILAVDQPYTFLFLRPDLHVVRPRVKGVRIDASGLYFHVREWWVADASGRS